MFDQPDKLTSFGFQTAFPGGTPPSTYIRFDPNLDLDDRYIDYGQDEDKVMQDVFDPENKSDSDITTNTTRIEMDDSGIHIRDLELSTTPSNLRIDRSPFSRQQDLPNKKFIIPNPANITESHAGRDHPDESREGKDNLYIRENSSSMISTSPSPGLRIMRGSSPLSELDSGESHEEGTSLLLDNYGFIICDESQNKPAMSRLSEKDTATLVEEHGGKHIADISELFEYQDNDLPEFTISKESPFVDLKAIFLLSSCARTTSTYLRALAFGIPCLKKKWLLDSLAREEVQDFGLYLLGSGMLPATPIADNDDNSPKVAHFGTQAIVARRNGFGLNDLLLGLPETQIMTGLSFTCIVKSSRTSQVDTEKQVSISN